MTYYDIGLLWLKNNKTYFKSKILSISTNIVNNFSILFLAHILVKGARPLRQKIKEKIIWAPLLKISSIRLLSTRQFRICVFSFTKIKKLLNFRENTHF